MTLVAGGDVALAGEPNAGTFARIRRFLRPADLAFANLEGTLAAGGSPRCVASAKAGCFIFRASPRWAATLSASGFTVLNVANNHALDYGRDAQAETLTALRREHLAVDGLPGQIARVRAGDVEVALIGVAPYRWAQSLLDVAGTAQRLFTHRHTIRYRLERVRELSGLDVGSSDGREKLSLGLKAMRVLGIAAPGGPATEAGAGGGRVPRASQTR